MFYNMNVKEDHPANLWNGSIVLITDDQQCRNEIAGLIKGIGGRIPEPLPLDFKMREMELRINAVAIIFDISNWDEATQRSFARTNAYCLGANLPLIVLTSIRFLDDALTVDNENIEFLLTDERSTLPAELVVTLNNLIKTHHSGLFASRDELDLVDLKKISEDVDRIAKVLSQLSGDNSGSADREMIQNPIVEPVPNPSVSDAAFKFGGLDGDSIKPYGSSSITTVENDGPISAEKVRDLIKARRLRDQYFNPELFSDPAWDMLLDLMAAKLEGTKVSVSSLCIAAAVPPTTALRWIKTMTEERVFVRRADEKDGRRVFIELSDEAAAGMVGYLSTIHRNGLAIV